MKNWNCLASLLPNLWFKRYMNLKSLLLFIKPYPLKANITLNVQTWLAQHRSQGLFSSSQVKEGSQRENPGTRLWLLKLRIQKFSFLVFCFTVFFLYLEQNLKRDLLKHFRAGRKIVYRSREYYFVVDGTRKKCHATRWTTMAYLWYKIPRSRPGRWQSLCDADKLNTHDPLGDCCCYEPLPSVFLYPF